MRRHILLAACLGCAVPASADELPTRKAGLWEIRMMVGAREMPMGNIQQCTDAETDALLTTNVSGAMGSSCGKPKITNSGGTITIDSACKIGSGTTNTHAVITGDFDSAYSITVTSTGGVAEGRGPMTMQAKWLGPCRQGQQPGDIIMPGGIKMNIRSLTKRNGAPPAR